VTYESLIVTFRRLLPLNIYKKHPLRYRPKLDNQASGSCASLVFINRGHILDLLYAIPSAYIFFGDL